MRARPDLAGELDLQELAERRRGLAALLRRPLLTAAVNAEDFACVRRHATSLAAWLWRYPGWRLEVDSERARLHKTPATLDDGSRPAQAPKGEPFSRRRYVLFCLALAALERSDQQTVLGALADDILDLAASDAQLAEAGMEFHLDDRAQRSDLVAVVRFLLHLGVLVKLDGDERQFINDKGDVLYDIRRSVLASLLDVRRAPSNIAGEDFEERLRLLTEEALPDSAEGRNRRLRMDLYRRLLDDPVLYFDQLDEPARLYLRSQRGAITRQIEDMTELRAEVRREGIAMVDERGGYTDVGLPEQGTDGHLTLLLAEVLANHLRLITAGSEPPPGVDVAAVGLASLEQTTIELIRRYERYWAKRVRRPGAAAQLLAQTLDRLEALGLVRRIEGGVVPLPAIGRFALEGFVPADQSDLESPP